MPQPGHCPSSKSLFSSLSLSIVAVVLNLTVWSPLAGAQDDNAPFEAKVSAPTRLDWTFVMGQRTQSNVPGDWLKDYQSVGQTYQMYIPDSYDPDEDSGLILFVSPTDQAMAVESRWKAVCDELGFILAAPNGAGNTCHPPIRVRIVLDVLDDVRQKFSIDPDRTYISGFSGGGRVACRTAFALPEYFGGVMPIGSTGEIRSELWLRERVTQRLSVANMIGKEDFNFVEVTMFRGPLFDAIGVRHKIWAIEGLKHEIPESSYLIEGMKWMDETTAQRDEYAKQYPASRVLPEQAPSSSELATALMEEANQAVTKPGSELHGQMLWRGIATRWPELPQAQEAAAKLQTDTQWREHEANTIRDYVLHRTRGLDAYATKETHPRYADQKKVRLEAAMLAWITLIREGKDQAIADEAKARLEVLREEYEKFGPSDSDDPSKQKKQP